MSTASIGFSPARLKFEIVFHPCLRPKETQVRRRIRRPAVVTNQGNKDGDNDPCGVAGLIIRFIGTLEVISETVDLAEGQSGAKLFCSVVQMPLEKREVDAESADTASTHTGLEDRNYKRPRKIGGLLNIEHWLPANPHTSPRVFEARFVPLYGAHGRPGCADQSRPYVTNSGVLDIL